MSRRIYAFFAVAALVTVSWITGTCGNLLTVPKNTVAKLGDRVKIECSTSPETSPLEWEFFSATYKNLSQIYFSGFITQEYTSKYSAENTTTGGYNLIMDSVDFSFGGTYTCRDTGESLQNSSAEIIVIASDPVCSTNVSDAVKEGDIIQMWCTVNYSGNWNPIMEWTTNNGQNVEDNTTYMLTSNTATSALTTQINSINKEAIFTCKTSFALITTNICITTQRPDEVCANNTPQYQHLWNCTASVSLDVDHRATDETSQDNSLFSIVGISVGAVALFVAITIIICKLCKRDKPKPDVVPQVEQDSYDTSDRPQPQPNPPLYAEVQRNSNGFQIVEHHPMPVYASVKKGRIVGEMNKQPVTNDYLRDQSIPIYAEVKKMENEKKMDVPSDQTPLPTDTKPKQNYTGADGTQYMELESLAELRSNGIAEKRPPLFNLVETYASIDHTMKAPPPPPLLAPRRH